MDGLFRDRTEAGRVLAPKLREFAHRSDVIVLALPRGGVPVGYQVARKLGVPMDVVTVRKLGVPGQEELAMGAVATGGVEFRDPATIQVFQISPAQVDDVARREREELERREREYRGSRPFPSLEGKTVILVDDGIATGSTMRAAIRAVKMKRAQSVVVAAPVASSEAVETLRREVFAVITIVTSVRLFSIGEYYRDFRQTTDQDVRSLLKQCSDDDTGPKTAAA
jgi:predicted phosphoribosyltransferase